MMFAQALITLLITWVVAELLCRIILGSSSVAAAKAVLSTGLSPQDREEERRLRRLLDERRQKPELAKNRLEQAALERDISEELAEVEEELCEVQSQLRTNEQLRQTRWTLPLGRR